jgi:hypothetical protein
MMSEGLSRGQVTDPNSRREHRRMILDHYAKIQKIVNDAKDDIEKAAGGNKAAGTRVRTAMQDLKNAAQEMRAAILSAREQPKP